MSRCSGWLMLVWALVFALPAAATQDAWPALFNVTKVEAGDVLNIRAAPSAQAPIIGRLKAGATDIEVIVPDERHRWGKINTAEGTGWVSLSYLLRQPGQWEGAIPAIRSCIGAEPFWNLSRTGNAVSMNTPEGASAPQQIAWEAPASGRRNIWGFSTGQGGDALTGIVRAEACSDTMSDRSYGLSLFLVMRNAGEPVLLSGCCSLSP